MLGSRKNNYLYDMKRSDLKELIKKSMLEVSPKSGAMTPEEEKMVADYEEEEANKYALDKEEPMEEAMVTPDNRVEFLANALGHVWNMGTGKNKIDLHSMAQSLVDDMFDEESMQENVLREADDIVAAYAEKKTLKEEIGGGYIELMEMNPKFDQGIEMLLDVWEEWKSGEMTEPEMIDEAKQDLLSYLSSVLH
jgi:hypothetical protein